jgi:dolichyl-diphosphooligosaccharide--protein glycosyltransferase
MFESLNFETEVKKVISGLKNGNKISLDSQAGKKINVNTTSRLKKRDFLEPKNNQRPDYFKVFLALALIGLVFVPCILIGAALTKSSDWVGPGPEWQKSLIWLQNSSPETSYYLQPSQIPEYGVLSWWDYGNWIVYLSKRPAISNNFQTGVEDSAYFFMSESEQEAKAIMDKLKVKYVITDTPMLNEKFGAIAHFAGKDSKDYFKQVNRTSVIGKEKLFNTEIFKLHDQNGANLGNLRLVHESNVFNVGHNKSNVVKIFEYVPGAKITGTSSPHKLVNVTLYLKSNTGRKFKYENKAMADMNGFFEITVPYSTEKTDSGINAISAYNLSAGENITEPVIYITESDVLNGNRIKI